MIRSLIEAMLGDFGRQILYFYEANAVLINSLVLVYGLFMFLSWNNLVRVYRFLIVEVAKSIHLSDGLSKKSTNKRIRDTIEIPWEKAVGAAPFPFIGRLGAFWPKRMSVEVLQMYFDEKEIVKQAVKLLEGTHLRSMTPSSRQLTEREREKKAEAKAPTPKVTAEDTYKDETKE